MQSSKRQEPRVPEQAGSWRIIRRSWILVVGVTVAVTVTVLVWSLLQPSVYSARAEVLVGPATNQVTSNGAVISLDEVASQRIVATSQPVIQAAVESLNGSVTASELQDSVTVEPIAGTRVLTFTAQTSDPEDAALWANAVANAFTAYRNDQALNAREAEERTLTAAAAKLTARLSEVAQLLARPKNADNAKLATEQRTLQAQLGQISAQLQSLGYSGLPAGAQAPDSAAQVIDAATVPSSATSPRPLYNTMLALLLGLLLGVAVALFSSSSRPGDSQE